LNIMEIATHQGVLVAKKNDALPQKEIKAMRPGRQKELRFLKEWKKEIKETPTIILVDEVQLMKKPTAKTAKALMKLMENSITYVLSDRNKSNVILEHCIYNLIYNNFYKNKSYFIKQLIP